MYIETAQINLFLKINLMYINYIMYIITNRTNSFPLYSIFVPLLMSAFNGKQSSVLITLPCVSNFLQ